MNIIWKLGRHLFFFELLPGQQVMGGNFWLYFQVTVSSIITVKNVDSILETLRCLWKYQNRKFGWSSFAI